jgi:hypothetical protein
MGSGSLRLGILRLLDDGLEPSTEGSSLDVVRHGDRTGREQAAVGEQYRRRNERYQWLGGTASHEQYRAARVTVAQG